MGVQFSGRILDDSGQPLEDAHIILNQGKYYGISNNDGRFRIKNIKPGTYQLAIQIIGYRKYQKTITIGQDGIKDYVIHLNTRDYHLNKIIVTATRTRKMMEDVPMPVTVIPKNHITDTGSMRLSDVLTESTGLRLTSSRGQTGLQVQGFNSDYTLVMINGEPVIGRRTGILDINRISVGDVKRIEIIKGPSSALWGSSALAGVVNIITKNAKKPFSLDLKSRYGTNQTFDAGGNLSWRLKNWMNSLFVDRNSSNGYSLIPNTISPTVPGYHNYTLSYRTKVPVSEHIKFKLYGRYYQGNNNGKGFTGNRQSPTLLDVSEDTRNYSIAPSLTVHLTDKLKLDLTHFISGYRNKRHLDYKKTGLAYQHSLFDQTFFKTDLKLTQRWNNRQRTTVGVGHNRTTLNSDRDLVRAPLKNLFMYGQQDWNITQKLDLIAGFRFDHHNTYGSQFSPKFSAQYKVTDWLHLRASTGRGFKAPDFSQLFLNFTNPTGGYTALGSKTVKERVHEMQKSGKITTLLRGLDQLKPIQAEHSWAFDAGFDVYPTNRLRMKVNFFQNNVDNLIDVSPIAVKNNGSFVYTYFNLHKSYTRGFETQIHWSPIKQLKLSLGYQYMNAKERVKQTKTVQDDQGNPVEKTIVSYETMFNRSKHSGTFKIFYSYEPLGIIANLRGIYRGRYGFSDANGNGYVDPDEYQSGYTTWNIAASKIFLDQYTLQLGVDNIFDFTRPQSLSYLPGRLFYVQVSLKF